MLTAKPSHSSFAAGMQNALATFFSGAVVRTTHVTGTATDVGIELASFMTGRSTDTWKLRLLTYFLFAFFLGGFLGTGGSVLWNKRALWWPSGLTLLLSVGSLLYYNDQQRQKTQAEFAIACKRILPAAGNVTTSTHPKAHVTLPRLVANDEKSIQGPERMRVTSFSDEGGAA